MRKECNFCKAIKNPHSKKLKGPNSVKIVIEIADEHIEIYEEANETLTIIIDWFLDLLFVHSCVCIIRAHIIDLVINERKFLIYGRN